MPIGAFRLAGLSYTFTDAAGTGGTGGRGRTITTNGDAQVDTGRQQFGGGSLLLDGTGDYLNVDLDTSTITGEFTWECWFNVDIDAGGGTVSILSNRHGSFGNGDIMMLFRNYDMKIQVNAGGGTSAFNANGVGSALAVDTWHHYAFVRDSSNNIGVFVNGTRVANSTWDGTLSSGSFAIGAHTDGAIPANAGTQCWIDEVRVSSTNRYDPTQTSITVPSTAFTDDTDTKLLLHMDGADGDTTFTDDDSAASTGTGGAGGAGGGATGRTAKTVTVFGNSQIDTAQSKFGGASLYVDGSGDYLSVADDADFNFSGDFTIEAWVRLDGTNPDFDHILGTWSNTNSLRQNFIGLDSGNKPVVYYMNGGSIQTDITGSSSLTTGNWYHIAWVGDSTNQRFYIDGTKVDETSQRYYSQDAANAFTIGADTGGSNPFNGWIDEVRVSNTARYNTNFTPESTAFANDTDTKLLLHMDGADGDTTFTDDTAAAAATPYTADGIIIPSNARLYGTIGTNNASSAQYQFTFSAWVKHDGTNFTYVWCGSNTDSNAGFAGGRVAIGATGFVQYYGYNGANNGWISQFNTADYVVAANTWTHIAVAFDNTSSFNNGVNAQIYVNGTSQTLSNTRFNTNANLGFDLATDMNLHGRRLPSVYSTGAMSYAQVWMDDTFVDLSTNIGSFIDVGNTRPVDMGTDGTMSGLSAPMAYHYGNTNTFYNNNGRTTGNNITYTFTAAGGTITDTDTDS